MFGIVFRVTDLVDNKRYIGITKRLLDQQWGKHCRDAEQGKDTTLCRAIRQHGKDNFTIEQLASAECEADLLAARDRLRRSRRPRRTRKKKQFCKRGHS